MRSTLLALSAFLFLTTLTTVHADDTVARVPVLVELFTSQGCSSCPAADDYVAQLVRTQPLKNVEIIALSQHVDYWDSLGWKDPYSSAQFSDRQRAYARKLDGGIYTPQVVIDGTAHFVGTDRANVLTAIRRAAHGDKTPVSLLVEAAETTVAIRVQVGDDVPKGAVLWVALSENGLVDQVNQGENRGRDLRHEAVARELKRVGNVSSEDETLVRFNLRNKWKRDQLRAVAFLADRNSGAILGVSAAAFPVTEATP